MDRRIGQVLKDRYRIIREVEHTDLESVYLGQDLLSEVPVTIRRFQYLHADPDSFREAEHLFRNEVNILCRLDHPGLPTILDEFSRGTEMFLITEHIFGDSLEEIQKRNSPLPEDVVLHWALEILKILEYLHSSYPPVIFRDIRPGNIVLTPEGRIRLLNMGFARIYKPLQGRDTIIRFSKGYSAPEQYVGKYQSDARVDIFALGVTLHSLLTGYNPAKASFNLPPATSLRRDLSSHWERIIARACDPDRTRRYPNVHEMRKDMEESFPEYFNVEKKEPAQRAMTADSPEHPECTEILAIPGVRRGLWPLLEECLNFIKSLLSR